MSGDASPIEGTFSRLRAFDDDLCRADVGADVDDSWVHFARAARLHDEELCFDRVSLHAAAAMSFGRTRRPGDRRRDREVVPEQRV